LVGSAKRFAGGDTSVRFDETSDDEFGALLVNCPVEKARKVAEHAAHAGQGPQVRVG